MSSSDAPTRDLRETTWTEVEPGALLVVPLGSLEQHGPHLPLAVDAVVAAAVAEGVSDRLATAGVRNLVAPVVPYGSSGEHQDFPGTLSIGTEALTYLLVELARSATEWAGGVVFVTGHGGNADSLADAVTLLRAEGRSACWTGCVSAGADAHAGATETSVMLHLAPWSVRLCAATGGATEPVTSLMPRLRSDGVRAVSPNGVLGDPTGATATAGSEILAEMVDRAFAQVVTSLDLQIGVLEEGACDE